jgi:hypothetical protein
VVSKDPVDSDEVVHRVLDLLVVDGIKEADIGVNV